MRLIFEEFETVDDIAMSLLYHICLETFRQLSEQFLPFAIVIHYFRLVLVELLDLVLC